MFSLITWHETFALYVHYKLNTTTPMTIISIPKIIPLFISSFKNLHEKRATTTKFNDAIVENSFKGTSRSAITEITVTTRKMAYALIVYTFRYAARNCAESPPVRDPIFRSSWLIPVRKTARKTSPREKIIKYNSPWPREKGQ